MRNKNRHINKLNNIHIYKMAGNTDNKVIILDDDIANEIAHAMAESEQQEQAGVDVDNNNSGGLNGDDETD